MYRCLCNIYIYIYMCLCMYVCMYIYIHIYTYSPIPHTAMFASIVSYIAQVTYMILLAPLRRGFWDFPANVESTDLTSQNINQPNKVFIR